MQGGSCTMNEYRNMAGPLPRYHQNPPTEGNRNYQYHGQHPYYQSNPAMGQNQWYQHGYGYTQNRKPLTCGPCNRTFYSQQRMDEHLKEHVDCPFPECKLSAHIKVIDQHINNQHMLVNFEALQIDDETWITERKKRFPSTQRAELRRVQQMEKLKRGEKLGVSKRPFNKDKMVRNKRGRDGKWIPNKDAKNQKLPSEGDNDGTNVEARTSSSANSGEPKKNFRDHVKRGKNHSQDSLETRETNFVDKRMRKRPKLENSLKPSIDVDLYESDEEVLGVPPFKGSRHFYESTGEVNYFSVSNLSKNSPEKEFVISDDEEWEEKNKEEEKMVLSGALGTLMCAYSDSEEEMKDETAAEPGFKVNKNLSETAGQTSSPKMITENAVNHTAKEESSRGRGKRRPRTHNKKGKKPINIQRRSKRRKPLLEKLLEADIIHERNIILQCVRYIIENDFFDKKVVGKADSEESRFKKGLSDSIEDKIRDTITMPEKLVVSNNDLSDLSGDQVLESGGLLKNGSSTDGKSESFEDTRDSTDEVILVKQGIVSESKSLACVASEDKCGKQMNDFVDEKVGGKTNTEEPRFQKGQCDSVKDKISDTITMPEKLVVSNNDSSDLSGDQIVESGVLANKGSSTEGESESYEDTRDNNDALVLVNQETVSESKSLACVSSEDKRESKDTITLPRNDKSTICVRDIVSSIIRDAWAKAQDWTVAWKAGKNHLKSVVESLINLQEQQQIDPLIHESALQLHTCITKMQACVSILDGLLENLKKVENLQREKKCNQPLFSTLTLHHMVCVLESVCEDYRKETEVKAGLCAVLPCSRNVDTLNTALTLWTHHAHLVTHQFPLKSLLRETQQL